MTTDSKTDRYVTFKGIDCRGQALHVVERLRRHIDDPAKTNEFWERFKGRLAQAADPCVTAPDELYLVCSHTYYLYDLFEEYEDEEGLAALKRIEDECC